MKTIKHPIGITSIKWKRVEPFSETDSDGVERYGFKIAGLATFLTETPLWLRCGSPGYVAPEILQNRTYDTKCDIFSCGIMMYILLSGRAPFPGREA